ncbi:MAG: tetratricopeptide repeat protein [Roseibacillus sp.]|nr:tetratricopeptide repeat protein [Roseibacillus sp.]NRB28707.1 tetratricopeptide repeat protein [Roseibacillus sp.]
MVEESIEESSPTEIGIEGLPKNLSDLVLKADAAIGQNNLGYAVKLLISVLKMEPGFIDGRKKLRAAEMKIAGPPKKKGLFGGGGAGKLKGKARKDPVGVIDDIEKELEKDPYNASLNELLHDVAFSVNMLDTAAFALETIRRATPDNTKLLHKLAQFYENRDMPEEAAGVYRDIVKADQTDTDAVKGEKDMTARASMARSQDSSGAFVMKDDEEALALEKASRSAMTQDQLEEKRDQLVLQYNEDVNNFDVAKKLSAIYEQMEDWAMAQQMYEWAYTLSAGDAALKMKVNNMKDRAGEEEIRSLEIRVSENPDDEEAHAALEEFQQTRAVAQVEERRKRVKQNPTDPQLRYDLGQALYHAREYSDAIPHLQQATRNPHIRTRVLLLLGRTFDAKGMRDMAIKQLSDANAELTVMDKIKKEVLYELGLIHEKVESKDEALDCFKQIYEVDYGYRDVAQRVESSYAG